MQKRYRVFISSTSDLEKERSIAIRAVQACDCIPAFMEVWPARAENLTERIKREINLCDFFVLLAGDRYGSREHDGNDAKSFVELEYNHALEQRPRIPIIVLMTGELTSYKRDHEDSEAQRRFRKKVREKHTAKSWRDDTELTRAIMASLMSEVVDRESAQVVENNADLVAAVNDYVNEQRNCKRKITRAVLIQFSAANAKDILKKLIWSGVNTQLYIASRETANAVNGWQKSQVEASNPENLQNYLEPLDPNADLGTLTLNTYRVKGSLRALMLELAVNDPCDASNGDERFQTSEVGFVAVGTYAYMIRWPMGKKYEDIRGGEMPMTVFRKEHDGCRLMASMIRSIINNWEQFDQIESKAVPLRRQPVSSETDKQLRGERKLTQSESSPPPASPKEFSLWGTAWAGDGRPPSGKLPTNPLQTPSNRIVETTHGFRNLHLRLRLIRHNFQSFQHRQNTQHQQRTHPPHTAPS